jgi:ABC-type sugar transport system substrate-binding protein
VDLTGRVAIVGLDQPEVARRLATEGAMVVIVGHDPDVAGALLAQIEIDAAPGARPPAFFRLAAPAPPPAEGPQQAASSGPTESELDALVEFVASQWPAR